MNLIAKLDLNWKNFSKNETAIAVSIAPSYAYENGRRTDTMEGYVVEVVLPELAFEKMRVKVSEKPQFSQRDIDTASSPLIVKFEDFSARFFVINGSERLSAKARTCVLIDSDLYADYTTN